MEESVWDVLAGLTVLAAIALAGGIAIRAVLVRRRQRFAAHAILLRSYWYTLRLPRLDIDSGTMRLVTPIFFGRRTLETPLDQVAPVAPAALPELSGLDGGIFSEGMSVPYLYTNFSTFEFPHRAPAPNLMLVFARPVRVPPLCAWAAMSEFIRLPFGYFSSRSAEGVTVDGVLLAAREPEDAMRRIVATGIEVVDDWREWLRRHPRDGAALGRRETPHARLLRGTVNTAAGTAALLTFLVLAVVIVQLAF